MAPIFYHSFIQYIYITLESLLGKSICRTNPTLYQHLTDIIFRKLLKEKYVVPSTACSMAKDVSVIEANAM